MNGRRKPRQPRPVINPLAFLAPAPRDQREKLLAKFLSALESITKGTHPSEDDWRLLSDAVNTVETLALNLGKLVPAEVMPVLNVAMQSMGEAARRYRDTGAAIRLDGKGIAALEEVIAIYADCLEGLTEREMQVAQEETARRIATLLRDPNPSPEVIAL